MKLYQRRHVISKFKTIIAVCVMAAISALCAVSAVASVSFTADVYWNANETKAWAENACSGPIGYNFYATAHIQSMSTGDFSNAYEESHGTLSTIIATTNHVSVTYPSPIPLVDYWGTHGFVNE